MATKSYLFFSVQVVLFFVKSLLLILLQSSLAFAFYNLSPKGFYEGLLGNNGIALDASVGANVYNPANLAGLEQNNFSAATSVLSVTQFKFSADQLNDQSQPPSFKSSSAYLMNQVKLGENFISFYFSNEIELQISKYFLMDLAGSKTATNIEALLNNSKLGFSYAQNISEKFSYGIGPIITLVNMRQTRLSKSQDSNATGANYNLESVSQSSYSVRFGGLYKEDIFNIGFYFEPEGQPLSTSRTEDNLYISTDGTVIDKSNNSAYNFSSAAQYGVGIKYIFNENHFVVADIDKVEQTNKTGSEDKRSPLVQSMGLGYSWIYNSDTTILTGFKYSEVLDDSYENNLTLINYFNLGVSTKIKFLTNLINAFHSKYMTLNSSNQSSSSIENTGISFATSYSY